MRALAVLAAFALAPRGARALGEGKMELVQVSDSDGTCQVFPAGMVADGFCEELTGADVMVFTSRGTLEEQYGNLKGMVAQTIAMAAQVSTPACVSEFTTMLCTTWFPPCDPETKLPRLPCMSMCTGMNTEEVCLATFEIGKKAGIGARIVKCEREIGDPAHDDDFAMPSYFASWKGTPLFRPPTYEEEINGVKATLACVPLLKEGGFSGGAVVEKKGPNKCPPKNCKYPLLFKRVPKMNDQLVEFFDADKWDYCNKTDDCDNCTTYCFFKCPYDLIYEDREWTIMWILNWLPGVASLPLSLLVVFSEYVKLKRMKKKNVTEFFILIAAAICVLYALFDSLPSMILGTDMRCDGVEFYSVYKTNGHRAQKVAQLKVNLMQSLMFTVVFTLWKVRQQLKASKSMSKYTPSAGNKLCALFFIVLLPISTAVLCYAYETDAKYELGTRYRTDHGGPVKIQTLATANDLRYAFTGGPKFNTTSQEYAFVQAPLLGAGLALLALSTSLVRLVFSMGASVSQKSTDGKNATLRKLAINMINFAIVSLICVIVNMAAVLMYLPNATEFGAKMGDFATCAGTGIPNEYWFPNGSLKEGASKHVFLETDRATTFAKCGDFTTLAPPASTLQLLLLSQSLPIFLFGFLFALPALKQLHQTTKEKLSRVGTSTSKSSASSSG